MSTIKTTATPLESSARAIFVGLLWGAAMLFVFGVWTRAKFDAAGLTKAYVFYALGGVAFALAAWQAFALWIQNVPSEQKAGNLLHQRRLLGFAMMAGGLGLIVMSGVLGVGKQAGGNYGYLLDNFGESIGALLFGLIALAGGYLLQSPPRDQDEPSSSLHFLADKQPILKLLSIGLCFAAIGVFCYFGYQYYKQTTTVSLAELAALLCFSIVCLACFLWLNTGVLNETDLRMFVIIFGGSAGVILFLLAIGRAIIWREDVFLSGLTGWQGERGYRIWVCAYLMFASVVLMIVSFNLARADIRTNKTLRLLMYGSDMLAQLLILFGILAALNLVVHAMAPFTYDWTKGRGAYVLSDSSKKLITGLKEETHIYVLVPQNSPMYKELHVLLDNCQALNNRLKVDYASPNLDPQNYERLIKLFPKILAEAQRGGTGSGVLVVAGPMPEKEGHNVPYEFIAERKLFDFERGPQGAAGSKTVFKGESEILKELKFLRQDPSKRKIYVLQGYDAPSISKQDLTERLDVRNGFGSVGIGLFVDKLKNDRYDVVGLSFQEDLGNQKTPNIVFAKEDGATKRKEIPSDCSTLIVAGVSKQLPNEVLEAIEHYLERGNKMMVFLNVVVSEDYSKIKDTGMETLLKRFGVDVKPNEFPLQLIRKTSDDPRLVWSSAPTESDIPLVRQFHVTDDVILMPRTARIVAPATQPGGRFKAETMLQLTPEPNAGLVTITEKNIRVLEDAHAYMMELRRNIPKLRQLVNKEAVPVAVAVKDSAANKPCLVVFGNTEFITNRVMATQRGRLVDYTFTSGALEWLAEREDLSGTSPRVSENFTLKPTVDPLRMILVPGWIMLLFIIGLGVTVWVVRRR